MMPFKWKWTERYSFYQYWTTRAPNQTAKQPFIIQQTQKKVLSMQDTLGKENTTIIKPKTFFFFHYWRILKTTITNGFTTLNPMLDPESNAMEDFWLCRKSQKKLFFLTFLSPFLAVVFPYLPPGKQPRKPSLILSSFSTMADQSSLLSPSFSTVSTLSFPFPLLKNRQNKTLWWLNLLLSLFLFETLLPCLREAKPKSNLNKGLFFSASPATNGPPPF